MNDHLRRRTARSALAASTAVALLAAAGCTSSKPAAHSSTTAASSSPTSTAAPTGDQLKATLIAAKDITIDKFSLLSTAPANQSDAVGINGIYANASHDRELSVILIRFPSTADAQAGLPEIQTAFAAELTHNPASDVAVAVGQGAQLYQGSNDTGPLSILVFAEGTYVVSMEFISKRAGDSVPQPVVVDLGKKQDALVKAAG